MSAPTACRQLRQLPWTRSTGGRTVGHKLFGLVWAYMHLPRIARSCTWCLAAAASALHHLAGLWLTAPASQQTSSHHQAGA